MESFDICFISFSILFNRLDNFQEYIIKLNIIHIEIKPRLQVCNFNLSLFHSYFMDNKINKHLNLMFLNKYKHYN